MSLFSKISSTSPHPAPRPRHLLRSALAVSSVLLALMGGTGAVLAQQSTIGLRLGVQPWTPVTNDDTVLFPLNDPGLISNALNKGWATYSGLLETAIKEQLGKGDLLADGFTFYDIDLHLTQPLLTIDQLKGSGLPGDPYQVSLHVDLQNEGVTMTSTQPAVGSWGDPRCHAEFDATLSMQLTISNTPGAAFSSPQTQPGSEPLAEITRFDFDSENFICDIPVDLAKMLGFKDFLTKLVSQHDGLVNKPLANAARGMLTNTIADLNSTVAAYQRPEINYAILRAWLVPQGAGKMVVLNLAPRAPLPDPSAGQGAMGGLLTVTAAGGVITKGTTGTVDCARLPVTISRVTGPRPMTSPLGTLGDVPLETLNVHTDCDGHVVAPGKTVRYRITGMSALFPQVVTFGSVEGACTSYEAGVRSGVDIKTTWQQGVQMPQTLYTDHNLTAHAMTIACGGVAKAFEDPRDRFLKYMIAEQIADPSERTLKIIKEYLNSRGLSLDVLKTLPKVKVQVPATTQTRTATPPAPPAPPPAPDCVPNNYANDPSLARAKQALNVRVGDSTDCAIIGALKSGNTVHVLSCTVASGDDSSWCRIDLFSKGRTGYVAKKYLTFVETDPSSEDVPPVVLKRRPRDNGGDVHLPGDGSDMQLPDNGDDPLDDGNYDNGNSDGGIYDNSGADNSDASNEGLPGDSQTGVPDGNPRNCIIVRGVMRCDPLPE